MIKYDNINIKEIEEMPDFQPGFCFHGTIYIYKHLSPHRKHEVLAEEIAHHFITYGNILDQRKLLNRRFEGYARRLAIEMIIPKNEIHTLICQGVCTIHEMANHFEVTEEFMLNAQNYYRLKAGISLLPN
ncbi:ImmA/IrrE family metallo-endopeptidase [Staphylococcus shinii]|uniref:ImmA/IrrE family metallo-endopeptidase n=2 Tax=Staphylococcus shinii TaxID=2912228 RepID=UPI003F56F416